MVDRDEKGTASGAEHKLGHLFHEPCFPAGDSGSVFPKSADDSRTAPARPRVLKRGGNPAFGQATRRRVPANAAGFRRRPGPDPRQCRSRTSTGPAVGDRHGRGFRGGLAPGGERWADTVQEGLRPRLRRALGQGLRAEREREGRGLRCSRPRLERRTEPLRGAAGRGAGECIGGVSAPWGFADEVLRIARRRCQSTW
jgi:hypothetical protein